MLALGWVCPRDKTKTSKNRNLTIYNCMIYDGSRIVGLLCSLWAGCANKTISKKLVKDMGGGSFCSSCSMLTIEQTVTVCGTVWNFINNEIMVTALQQTKICELK